MWSVWTGQELFVRLGLRKQAEKQNVENFN